MHLCCIFVCVACRKRRRLPAPNHEPDGPCWHWSVVHRRLNFAFIGSGVIAGLVMGRVVPDGDGHLHQQGVVLRILFVLASVSLLGCQACRAVVTCHEHMLLV